MLSRHFKVNHEQFYFRFSKIRDTLVPLAIRSSTKSGCQAKGNAIEDALIINQCDLTIRSMRGIYTRG